MINLQVDTLKLESEIVRFAKAGKGDIRKIVRQQSAILVGHMIAVTPPGKARGQSFSDTGGIALTAKKEGEARVAADIRKIFPTSGKREEVLWGMVEAGHEWKIGRGHKMKVRQVATSEADLARIHAQARNPRTGRTRKLRGINGAVTRKGLLSAYVRSQKKRVGLLNSGWIAAATELKTAKRAVPAWITRHGKARGGVNISNASGKIGIRIFNSQSWFPGDMESRAKLAVTRRQRGLVKAIDVILKRNAAKANQRMGN